MEKQLHHRLIDFCKNNLPRYQQDFVERQRQADKVVIWLTAISAGAIALILSQSEKLHINDPIYLKLSIALLVLSVICGVTYRSFFYPLEELQVQKILCFEGYCHGRSFEVSGPIDILEGHTIKDIANSLKNDMGIDYDHWLEHDYLDRDFWIELYNSWAEFWKKSEESGIDELSKAIAVLQNKKPEEAENLLTASFNDNSLRRRISIFTFICNCSYHLILVFFVLAVMTLAIGYMTTDCLTSAQIGHI